MKRRKVAVLCDRKVMDHKEREQKMIARNTPPRFYTSDSSPSLFAISGTTKQLPRQGGTLVFLLSFPRTPFPSTQPISPQYNYLKCGYSHDSVNPFIHERLGCYILSYGVEREIKRMLEEAGHLEGINQHNKRLEGGLAHPPPFFLIVSFWPLGLFLPPA